MAGLTRTRGCQPQTNCFQVYPLAYPPGCYAVRLRGSSGKVLWHSTGHYATLAAAKISLGKMRSAAQSARTEVVDVTGLPI